MKISTASLILHGLRGASGRWARSASEDGAGHFHDCRSLWRLTSRMDWANFRMASAVASLMLPFVLGFADNAKAQNYTCINTPGPTLEIRIQNNSTDTTIYPVFDLGIKDPNLNSTDLWMQAQCQIKNPPNNDHNERSFPTTKVYRAYVNLDSNIPGGDDTPTGGIPPGKMVKITVPFYTQLRSDVTVNNLGMKNQTDQFIDWWNAARIYFFYGKPAVKSAYLDGQPTDITFAASNQLKPTCVFTVAPTDCTVVFKSHTIDPRANLPFQLQEYTFASALGPPPGGLTPCPGPQCKFSIDITRVNYNVSSLDSVYLPVAMGPILNGGPTNDKTHYLGDGASVSSFNTTLSTFTNNGQGWPFYIPIYFEDPNNESIANWPPLETKPGVVFPPCSFINPFTDSKFPIPPYLAPKIPGTDNLILESNRFSTDGARLVTVIPPLLSSQPSNYAMIPNFNQNQCGSANGPPTFTSPPGFGVNGNQVITVWTGCLNGSLTGNDMGTCDKIKEVNAFFLRNYDQVTCWKKIPPDLPAVMHGVYGWVPITAPLYPKANETICAGGALKDTQGTPNFSTVIKDYCELQYNYLLVQNGMDPKFVFNPYTLLIHDTLGSSAYAFSIDDAQAFRSLIAPGVIITIGGTAGLDDTVPTPLPTADTFQQFCRQG
jgi:hypothetical protein